MLQAMLLGLSYLHINQHSMKSIAELLKIKGGWDNLSRLSPSETKLALN